MQRVYIYISYIFIQIAISRYAPFLGTQMIASPLCFFSHPSIPVVSPQEDALAPSGGRGKDRGPAWYFEDRRQHLPFGHQHLWRTARDKWYVFGLGIQ